MSNKPGHIFKGNHVTGGKAHFGDHLTHIEHVHNFHSISPPDAAPSFFNIVLGSNYKNVNPDRFTGTCGWFIDHPSFQRWNTSTHDDLLFLLAEPGCGKSVLCKALIDDRLVGNESATICYFFFKDDEQQNSITTAMCALLHQLFCAQEHLFQSHALASIYRHGESLRKDFESLWQLWISATSASVGNVICVLDALDECQQSDCDRLIKKLGCFYDDMFKRGDRRDQLSNVKFLATGRPYLNIEYEIDSRTQCYPTIRLGSGDEQKRLRKEMHMVLENEIKGIKGLSGGCQTALIQKFSTFSSKTTFLWLYLTLNMLKRSTSKNEKRLLELIDTLSENVEDAYERILQRCGNEENASRVLQIIIAATRPLTLPEIDVALEVDPGTKCYDDLKLEGSNRGAWIRDACALFVNIIDSRVYLIHQTAKEFLLQQPGETVTSGVWKHSISWHDSHMLLANVCMDYLQFLDFQKARLEKSDESTSDSGYKVFVDYPVNNWIFHTQQATCSDNDENFIRKAVRLCDELRYFWGVHHPSNSDFGTRKGRRNTPIIWAAAFGVFLAIPVLLKGVSANDESVEYIVIAAAANSETGDAVMELLIKQLGPNIPITHGVLMVAAGNIGCGGAVMKVLLNQQRDDIKITEDLFLAAAVNYGDGLALMELLLDYQRGDIGELEDLLPRAASNTGFGEAMVKLLLSRRDIPKVNLQVTLDVLIAAAGNTSHGEAVMKIFLGHEMTPEVLVAAASNIGSGGAVMDLLLSHQRNDIEITPDVFLAAAGNVGNGDTVMKLLLGRQGDEFEATHDLFIVAAGNMLSGAAVMQLLLQRRGSDFRITPDLLFAIAGNHGDGDAIMQHLLAQSGFEFEIGFDFYTLMAEALAQGRSGDANNLWRLGQRFSLS